MLPTPPASPIRSPFFVAVPRELVVHIDAAATRLGYLNPSLKFSSVPDGLEVRGLVRDEVELRREVLHAVYRERILERTLPLRRSLIDGLLSS